VSYETEEQQVEALKEWWAENGRAVLLGIGLGIAVIAGYTYWQHSREQSAVAASDGYSESIEALRSGDVAKAQALAQEVSEEHGGALYASYARLAAARAAVEDNDLAAAAEHLNWTVKNTDHPDVKLIAQIRLARVMGEQGEPAAGLAALPSTFDAAFKGIVEEARGDLHMLAGDAAAARSAYQAATEAGGTPNPTALSIKLNDLAETSDAS